MKHDKEDETAVGPHMKEATQNVLVTLFLSTTGTEQKHGTFKMVMAFQDVPVSATDERLKSLAVDELDKVYQAQKTLRLLTDDDKPAILDAEDVKRIIVNDFLIKRGE